jgi:hypothetical protein
MVSKKSPDSPFSVAVPDSLKYVEFIEKDSQRFPETNGWGYAEFLYDAASDTFAAEGALSGEWRMSRLPHDRRGERLHLYVIPKEVRLGVTKFWTRRLDVERMASRR